MAAAGVASASDEPAETRHARMNIQVTDSGFSGSISYPHREDITWRDPAKLEHPCPPLGIDIEELEQLANDRFNEGLPWYATIMQRAASLAIRDGELERAEPMLDFIEANPEDIADLIHAKRSRALIAGRRGDRGREAALYAESLDMIIANPNYAKTRASTFSITASNVLATSYQRGPVHRRNAIKAAQAVLDEELGVNVWPQTKAFAAVRLAQIYLADGDTASAIDAYRFIDEELSGAADDYFGLIAPRMNLARLEDPDRKSQRYIEVLERAWGEPAARSNSHVLSAGIELAEAHRRNGDIGTCIDILNEARQLAETNRTEWIDQAQNPSAPAAENLRQIQRRIVAYSRLSVDHAHIGLAVADELLAAPTSTDEKRQIIRQRDELIDLMNR